MTLNSRQLTATLIATLVMLTMSSSAHADALTSYRAPAIAEAPLMDRHLGETSGGMRDRFERRRGDGSDVGGHRTRRRAAVQRARRHG